MTVTTAHTVVRADGGTLSVTRGGHGRLLVFCPGLTSTLSDVRELIGLLREHYEVVAFDLRGHGGSGAAETYSVGDFVDDFDCVIAELPRLGLCAAPIVVGHSLGADVVVQHASRYPDSVAGLVLVDGALPLPAPFITTADLPEFVALWEQFATWKQSVAGTSEQVVLTAQQILEVNLELDVWRSGLDVDLDVVGEGILGAYRAIDRPIRMIASTAMAGDGLAGRAPRHNRLWREGVRRLVADQPQIAVSYLDASHAMVVTHAAALARIIHATQHLDE